jgi:hypothetical protein
MPEFSNSVAPIGWSESSSFALIARTYWSNSVPESGYEFTYTIVDAVSDTTLWEKTDSVTTASSIGDIQSTLSPEDQSWQSMKSELFSRLEQANIVQNFQPLQPFPANIAGRKFSAYFKNVLREGMQIMSFELWISRDTYKEKRITARRIEQHFPPTNAEILGFFESPFEPRILVVFKTSGRGFEGEPFSDIGFSECHLNVGFKAIEGR